MDAERIALNEAEGLVVDLVALAGMAAIVLYSITRRILRRP